MQVLDVGCGPGGLTSELVHRVGADAVAAIDPTPPFVEACRARNPGVDVRPGSAENLPFEDGSFDATLSSLVVGFMQDPHEGAREMARVTRPGGVVAACFWNAEMPLLATFWTAAARVDSTRGEGATTDNSRFGRRQGEIADLLAAAGLSNVEETTIYANADYADFDDWWRPFAYGIGPAGAFCAALDPERRDEVRLTCRELLGNPTGPFTLEAGAWCARGTV
jgi:SAM-dependent methyltransferase